MNLDVSSSQLRRAADIVEQIERLQAEFDQLVGTSAPVKESSPVRKKRRGTMSEEGRARIAEAQRRRWAAQKAGKKKDAKS